MIFGYTFFFFCSIACSTGYYGENCKSRCGHCVDDTTCDHITGNCVRGCKSGYRGYFCDTGNGYRY